MSKTFQRELGGAVGQVFNLAGESAEDPDRIIRERLVQEQAAIAAREFQARMQRTLVECPGFIGGDLPRGEGCPGVVVVEPGRAMEARTWLKRRFACNDAVDLSDQGLAIEIVTRRKGKSRAKRCRVQFGKLEQFTFDL